MIKHVFLIKFIPNFKELVIFYFICVFKSLETLFNVLTNIICCYRKFAIIFY